jgi:glycosyltransferase involved in cell wall biosynthesis
LSRPIRLAFVLPHLRPGGAERVVANLLRALDRSRFEPFLFLAREEGAFLDLVPGDVVRVGLGGRRARQLPRRLARALEAHRIDAAYSATAAINLALVASLLWGARRTRRIVSEHTNPASALAEAGHPRLRRLLMRHLYPRADCVAVPTGAIDRELRQVLGRPRLRTRVLPNPVVEAIAARPRPLPLPRPRHRLVSAGRLVAAKGYDILIDAAAALAGRGVEFDLQIHGEGPLEGALRQRIRERGLQDRVALAGYRADLADSLAAADLFVLASRREGFGNVIVEAMAAGLPVLAAASSGPASLIADGRNGFLARPESAPALADAIEGLLTDPARRASVVEEGYRTAARFEVAAATREFEEMVAALLAARPHPRRRSLR